MKTSNWDNTQKELLKGLLGDVRTKFLGYNVLNKRTTQGVLFEKLSDYDVVLGHDAEHSVFVAWSAVAHRIIDSSAKAHTFSLHAKAKNLIDCKAPIVCFYQRIEGTKKPEYNALEYYEKIVLVREEYITDFCKYPLLYLMPNREDEGYKDNTVYEDMILRRLCISNARHDGMWYSKEERIRYNCSRQSRDISFRKRVLNTYGCKCAICGESVEEVIQAAHIIAVEHGGSDDTENGVCLCANHHLMFDSHLFYIDHKTRKIYGIDPRLTDTIEAKYV